MAKSGGVTARNTRQGFRSEYIAKYIFSSFGTAVNVSSENDLGIDLLCNLTSFEGKLIYFKSSYGIQVKSKGSAFTYSGKQATKWLSKLEFPLLLVEVDKENSRIKVYSTWSLNKYLIGILTNDESKFPDKVEFLISEDDKLAPPNSTTGHIPIGKPILDFEFADIDDSDKWTLYYEILSEWLEMDNENYKLRRAGISRSFGYTSWTTNQKPSAGYGFDVFYGYSPNYDAEITKLIIHSLTVQGMYNKASSNNGNIESFKIRFNDIRSFALKHLWNEMDEFEKSVFQNEI